MQDSAGHVMAGARVGARWTEPVPPALRLAMLGTAVVILAVVGIQKLDLTMRYWLTWTFFTEQDMPVMLTMAGLLVAVALVGLPAAIGRWSQHLLVSTRLTRAGLIAAAGVAVVIGMHVASVDFPYSRDEIMALFDAAIIADGRLLAPVPPEWRPYVPALQPVFRLPVPDHAGWASTYLPGNAAIRGVLGLVMDRPFVNATLLVIALVAMLDIARRIWPNRPDAWLMALLLVVTSSQALFMSATPYAMSAHLAVNLVWLSLFLRNTVWSHAAAIALGFLGTGLHQLVFHPLFVAPFLLQLLFDRRIGLMLVYGVAYAAIGLFWILYWQFLLAGTGTAAPEAASAMGMSYFLTRMSQLFANMYTSAWETMVQNLFRFAAWQNPLTVVLIGPGLVAAFAAGGVLRALAIGFIATILTMLLLLPYQDIGWGYRYAHGILASVALVATAGWLSLLDRFTSVERRTAYGVAGLAMVGALVLIPIHGVMMRSMIEPYKIADRAMRAKPVDVVVIETVAIHYGDDLVRNDPKLRDRPITLDIGELNEDLLAKLCRRYDVAMFRGHEAVAVGVRPAPDPTKHQGWPLMSKLMATIEGPDCRAMKGQ